MSYTFQKLSYTPLTELDQFDGNRVADILDMVGRYCGELEDGTIIHHVSTEALPEAPALTDERREDVEMDAEIRQALRGIAEANGGDVEIIY